MIRQSMDVKNKNKIYKHQTVIKLSTPSVKLLSVYGRQFGALLYSTCIWRSGISWNIHAFVFSHCQSIYSIYISMALRQDLFYTWNENVCAFQIRSASSREIVFSLNHYSRGRAALTRALTRVYHDTLHTVPYKAPDRISTNCCDFGKLLIASRRALGSFKTCDMQ